MVTHFPPTRASLRPEHFFECINKCLPYTLQPNGTVSGFLIFQFFDSTKANTFTSTAQQRCRYDSGGGSHTCQAMGN